MIHDLDLTQDERLLLASTREWAQEVVLPRAKEAFETSEVPLDLVKQLGELGYSGLLVPEEQGGAGASTVLYMAVLEELAKADPTTALTLQVHVLVTEIYRRHATPEQLATWLPRLVSGEILAAVAMTEPEAGSDLRAGRTTAVRDGDDWVINGQKVFITNAGTSMSDGLVVLARTGEDERGRPAHSTFIVPRDTPGLVMGQRLKKIGWRHMDTREVFLEDCRVPAGNLLGPLGGGLTQVLEGLELGRMAFGSVSVGIAQACLEYSLEYAQQRRQFGRPIARFQAIQMKLADMATKTEAARSLVHDAARRRDLGMPETQAASMAKLFGSRTAMEVSDEAYQIFGGYGTSVEYPIARYYLDAKLMEIGEGTNEIQRLTIARSLGC
jgi:alkylation response protein AidB-like acyl-CoA dehydrogenase